MSMGEEANKYGLREYSFEMEGGVVGRISGVKLLHCDICGDDVQSHLFASPLTSRVICMKCAKEKK